MNQLGVRYDHFDLTFCLQRNEGSSFLKVASSIEYNPRLQAIWPRLLLIGCGEVFTLVSSHTKDAGRCHETARGDPNQRRHNPKELELVYGLLSFFSAQVTHDKTMDACIMEVDPTEEEAQLKSFSCLG